MAEAILIESRGARRTAHIALATAKPEDLEPAVHPLAWKILVELARQPDYANALARRLRMHEQKVYYHVNRLRKAGLLKTLSEERGRGAVSRILAPSAEAFALVLPGGGAPFADPTPPSGPLRAFLDEFAKDGTLDAWIVLGAPTPHGPFLTAARDSPYAAQLGLFLGRHFAVRRGLAVKLDTEVKAEGFEKGNLILVGGPVANIVSLDLNPGLAVSFDWREVWRLRSSRTGKSYGDESIGLVAKVPNPWGAGKWILLLAGLHYPGTIASLLAVTDHTEALLKGYQGGELFHVVQGLDRDGDGRLDDVQIVE
jgi:DNA-binding MarR family transcriptional regulator